MNMTDRITIDAKGIEKYDDGVVVVRHAITGEPIKTFTMRTGKDGKSFYFFYTQEEYDKYIADNPGLFLDESLAPELFKK